MGLWIFVGAGAILAWGLWPISFREEFLFPSGLSRLEVRWPTKVRSGDQYPIHMTILIDGNQEELSNLDKSGFRYDSLRTISLLNNRKNHLLAEARLEMSEALVNPDEIISQPVLSGKPVTFSWRVQPNRLHTNSGILWLYLQEVSISGEAEPRQPIMAKTIEIQTIDLIGLTGRGARMIGGFGSLLAMILCGSAGFMGLRGKYPLQGGHQR
jgi:hypothetical protein